MKRIILCADDYGQNSAISQAIIHLLKNKRLSATSCMTNAPEWLIQAESLRSYRDLADIGLHFNLTEGNPLSSSRTFSSLGQLMVRSYLGLLNQAFIETELNLQIDRFEEGLGQAPDFIDGHQHIHQLPGVRDAVLQVYQKRFPDKKPYIRNVTMPFWAQRFIGNAQFKRIIIQLCGARSFQKQIQALGIPHNSSFSGIYEFVHAENYPHIFPHFLKEIQNQGIIMCHPAYSSTSEDDSIAESRDNECQYLSSEQFIQDCETYQIQLGRFNR